MQRQQKSIGLAYSRREFFTRTPRSVATPSNFLNKCPLRLLFYYKTAGAVMKLPTFNIRSTGIRFVIFFPRHSRLRDAVLI